MIKTKINQDNSLEILNKLIKHEITRRENMDREFKEMRQQFKESDRRFHESIKKSAKESDRRFKESAKETDRILKESTKEIDRRFKETDRRFKETARRFKETDRKFKETSDLIKESSLKADKYLGIVKDLDRNWGKLVEALVAPGMVEQFKKINLDIDGMTQRVLKRKQGRSIEIDILLLNSSIIIPVEVKTTLNVDAVNEHITKHLNPFKEFFPEYIDKKIYGAVAYINVEENADKYAYRKGLYVLTFGDSDLVVIKNDSKFRPNEW